MQAAGAAYVEPDSRMNEGRGEIKQSSCFHWPILLYGPYFKVFLFVLDTPEHCGKSSNGWQLTSSTGNLTPRVVLTQPPPLPATDHIVGANFTCSFPPKGEKLTCSVAPPLPTKSFDFVGALYDASTLGR